MARPIKNNCDYFSHDNNMRNHVKVKAIRQKFSNGYAIWVMFLEYLTGADGNVFEYTELNLELLSGDFGFTSEEIKGVIEYALKLEMISIDKESFINSYSLDERLASVYEKRGQAKDRSEKQKRILGKFATGTTDTTLVSVTETPITVTETSQSKVNKSKVKENIEYIYSLYPSRCPIRGASNGKSQKNKEKIKTLLTLYSFEELSKKIQDYISECKISKSYMKNFATFLNNIPDDISEPIISTSQSKEDSYKSKGVVIDKGSIQF